jgi:hypothetical protein
MKKFILLSVFSVLAIGCQRSADAETINDEASESSLCNKTVNPNTTVNPWGVLSRTTCNPGPGSETSSVSKMNDPLFVSKGSTDKASTKAVHFWFYGTNSSKLFKPVTYARVFVFNDDATDQAKINAAKAQVQTGNHYLGFDTVTSSYNLESEIKKSLPTNKRIFVQFIVQSSPATTLPTLFDTNKYAYCEFTNADNGIYDHYKIDYSDSNLGYQGNTFFYN